MQMSVRCVKFCALSSNFSLTADSSWPPDGPSLHANHLFDVEGKSVVDDDVEPVSVLPKPEVEDSRVIRVKVLMHRHDAVEQVPSVEIQEDSLVVRG